MKNNIYVAEYIGVFHDNQQKKYTPRKRGKENPISSVKPQGM